MHAWAENSAASRSGDPRHFPRAPLPVLTRADARTTNRDRDCGVKPDQTFDSHRRLPASKAEGHTSPHRDHSPRLFGNREVPCRDFPGPRKSWLPPKRRVAWWGPLSLHVPHFAPVRQFARRSDRRPPNPASTARRTDSGRRPSGNLRLPRLESRPIKRNFGLEGRDTRNWTTPGARLFADPASQVLLRDGLRSTRAKSARDTFR